MFKEEDAWEVKLSEVYKGRVWKGHMEEIINEKMNLGSFDGRKNELEGPIEKITWGGWKLQDETNKYDYLGAMKAARWNQQRRLPGGDESCKMKQTKKGRTLLWR